MGAIILKLFLFPICLWKNTLEVLRPTPAVHPLAKLTPALFIGRDKGWGPYPHLVLLSYWTDQRQQSSDLFSNFQGVALFFNFQILK